LPIGTINGFVASIFLAFFKVFFAIFVPPRLIRPCGRRSSHMQRSRQTERSVAILQEAPFLADGNRPAIRALQSHGAGVEIIIAQLKISTAWPAGGVRRAEASTNRESWGKLPRKEKGRQPRGGGPFIITIWPDGAPRH
jgi:hypothetical protein